MNPITLTFKDKQLEAKFNKGEETVLLDKLQQIIIVFIIVSILGMYFWFNKGQLIFASFSGFMIIAICFLYYVIIYKKRFNEYIPHILLNFSTAASGYQILIDLLEIDLPQKELSMLKDAVMLSIFVYQIHNNFLLNTFQYSLFITCRIFIFFELDCIIQMSTAFVFSTVIIHNDYIRIKAMRNRFLLQLYNTNQLKMLENLEQPILVLEFQETTQRLVEYFVNRAFLDKIIDIEVIQFIKNCQLEKKERLYTVIQNRINQQGSLKSLKVKFNNTQYQVNTEIYKGERMLVALEFLKITKKNVKAQPYFYKSLLNYVQKYDKHQYVIEIMKNICGFLLYRPNQLKLHNKQISILKIIHLANPQLIQSDIDKAEHLTSNFLLISLFFYILSKCFYILKLELTKEDQSNKQFYRFRIIGNLNGKYQVKEQVVQKINILKNIIHLIGLDDFNLNTNSCEFTLINLEDQFLTL